MNVCLALQPVCKYSLSAFAKRMASSSSLDSSSAKSANVDHTQARSLPQFGFSCMRGVTAEEIRRSIHNDIFCKGKQKLKKWCVCGEGVGCVCSGYRRKMKHHFIFKLLGTKHIFLDLTNRFCPSLQWSCNILLCTASHWNKTTKSVNKLSAALPETWTRMLFVYQE